MKKLVIKHRHSWTLSISCALHSPQGNLRNLARNSIFKCFFQSYGLLLWIYVTNLTLIWAEVIPTSNRHRITHKLDRHSSPNSTSTRQTHRLRNSDPCHLLSSITIANFDCPHGIVIMHLPVIVPLCMMTWSNTLVYSCECVCFVLLFYLVNVFFYVPCVVWCLLTCSVFRYNCCRDWINQRHKKQFISRLWWNLNIFSEKMPMLHHKAISWHL
jgi:hypothetical protein